MRSEISKKLVVVNQLGIHARPAAVIVKAMQKYDAHVYLIYNGHRRNAKSVLQVLSLGAPKDAEITAVASGPDAESAIEELSKIFEGGFGEE
ncbi:MAG: HPr family phosphocarrier protein [Candidatus Hydrogenedentes bacterium]|nr:HPr family phosphocarrier protein [Candidatus Hydrogenedentota bacterium]